MGVVSLNSPLFEIPLPGSPTQIKPFTVEVSSLDWLVLLAQHVKVHFAVHQSNLAFHYYQVDLKCGISAQSSWQLCLLYRLCSIHIPLTSSALFLFFLQILIAVQSYKAASSSSPSLYFGQQLSVKRLICVGNVYHRDKNVPSNTIKRQSCI